MIRVTLSALLVVFVIAAAFLSGCTSTLGSQDTSPTLAPTSKPSPVAKCAKMQFISRETGPITIGGILSDERDFPLSHKVTILLSDKSSASRFATLVKSRRPILSAVIDDPGDGASFALHSVIVTKLGKIPPALTGSLWVVMSVGTISPKRTIAKCRPKWPAH